MTYRNTSGNSSLDATTRNPYPKYGPLILLLAYGSFWLLVVGLGADSTNPVATFLSKLGISLFWGIIAYMLIVDWSGSVSLGGKIHWRSIPGDKRFVPGCLYVLFFPLLLGLYLLIAVFSYRSFAPLVRDFPELGAYRVRAAPEQIGIHLSQATCGRLLSLNRKLYGLSAPPDGAPRERKHAIQGPFQTGDLVCGAFRVASLLACPVYKPRRKVRALSDIVQLPLFDAEPTALAAGETATENVKREQPHLSLIWQKPE